jgi:hypothetical protein
MGKPSHKQFILPDGTVIQPQKLQNIHLKSKNLPRFSTSHLASVKTLLLAQSNLQMQTTSQSLTKTQLTSTMPMIQSSLSPKGANLWGWRDKNSNLWHIPLVRMVRNLNTNTVLLNCPPSKFLLNRPDPVEAVHSVYELKTQPELVRYLHASAVFPTKPTWLKAIKNQQFSSWPGLTTDAVRHHFPDLDKIHKGHGGCTPSGLRSTKQTQAAVQPEEQDDDKNIIATKQKPSSSKSRILRKKP